MRRHAILAACLVASWPAQAEPVPLEGEALKRTVTGRTVNLDTPVGIAIPITYHGNGMLSGQAGVLAYILGTEKDRGRWWVADGKLCQRWFNWLDAKPNCMRVRQDGQKFYWNSDDGKSGTATIASALPPGAAAAPRGLGGPAHAPTPQKSLVADEPEDDEAPPSRPVPAAARPVAAKASPKPVPTPVKVPRMQQLSAAVPHPPIQMHEERSPAHPAVDFLAAQIDRWCHGDSVEAIERAAPDLVFITRLAYHADTTAAPTNACLSAEPSLKFTATLSFGR